MLAIVGMGLLVVAVTVPRLSYSETPPGRVRAVRGALMVVGVAQARWRGGVPIVALLLAGLYAAVGARAGLRVYREAEQRRAWYLADPSRATFEPVDDGAALLVRSAAGHWRVPADACPGATRGPRDSYGWTVEHGVFEITFGDDAPYSVRLHVAERRVTCPPPGPLCRPSMSR